MQQFKTFLQRVLEVLIPLSTPIVLLLVLLTSRAVTEIIVALVLIFGMEFYYTKPMQSLILKLPVESDASQNMVNTIVQWMGEGQGFILDHLPAFDGISVFGKRFLHVSIDGQFVPTWWPIAILFVGVSVRLVVGRFVRHERLRQVAREYWLFITGYTILALMVSDITHWNFLIMLLATLIVVFVLTAGLLRVGTDLIRGLWISFKIMSRSSKIVLQRDFTLVD